MKKILIVMLLSAWCLSCFAESESDEEINKYELQANNGDMEAMLWLGRYYYEVGCEPLTTAFYNIGDVDKAIYWYKKAYRKGSIEGMYCYAGLTQNAKLMKKAADKGHVMAAYAYGKYCMSGNHHKKIREAIYYLDKASCSFPHAFWSLGVIYGSPGIGGEYYDMNKAIHYYRVGCQMGDSSCGDALRRIEQLGY